MMSGHKESIGGNIDDGRRIAAFLKKKINESGEGHSGRERWTDAVQAALRAFLKEENYLNNSEVLPPGTESNKNDRKDAFLLDFVLWRRDLGGGGKEGAWIACESEWDRDAESILKDFDKLLSFRAPYNVMIYGVKEQTTLGVNCRREFERHLSIFNWHLENEVYIFLEFVNSDRIANIYTCVPSEKGTLTLFDD
jgi:hypothetical protein